MVMLEILRYLFAAKVNVVLGANSFTLFLAKKTVEEVKYFGIGI